MEDHVSICVRTNMFSMRMVVDQNVSNLVDLEMISQMHIQSEVSMEMY